MASGASVFIVAREQARRGRSQPRLAPRSLRPELELEPGPCAHLAHAARTAKENTGVRCLSPPERKRTGGREASENQLSPSQTQQQPDRGPAAGAAAAP